MSDVALLGHRTVEYGAQNATKMPWMVVRVLVSVSCPDPSPKSGRGSGVLNDFFLSHGAESNGVKNVIIASPHAACKMIPRVR